ncbi:MAG TPA: hypothetical protein VJ783_14195 [Pirellulales bacterium]|nr:hypothetical protein [Pirellulales bacterium]
MAIAPHRLILLALAALHLVAGVMLAWSIDAGIGSPGAAVLLDALVYADAGLLAVWAGLGRHSKWAGFFGVGLGMACLASLVAWALRHSMSGLIGPGNDFWTTVWLWLFQLALALLSMAVALAVLLRLRQLGLVLQRVRRAEALTQPSEIQFSLRQLMLLVFFVAALVKLGPLMRAHLNDYRSYVSSVVALSLGALCLGTTTLIGLWAALGSRATVGRAAVALALAASFGLLPPYYFPDLFSGDFAASVAVVVAVEFITLGSLLAVRWLGFRLGPSGEASLSQ